MNNINKYALVLGGCGRASRFTVHKLLNDGYTVVIVDNLSCSKHPKDWVDYPDMWENEKLVFYEEDVIKFMNDENMFTLVTWDVVIQRAKIKSPNYVEEVTTNTIIDATFFRWLNRLQNKPRVIIANQESQIARDLTVHLQIPFAPVFP